MEEHSDTSLPLATRPEARNQDTFLVLDRPPAAEEPGMDSADFWSILGRRRWWILGAFFLGWAAVWALSWLLPPLYRSETLILVEQQKVPQEYVASNVAVDFQQRLQTMTQQILSRSRLQRIIDDFHLYPGLRNRVSPDEVIDQMRKDIDVDLVETPAKKELKAFHVFYSAPTPQLAQQVNSQLTSLFVQENLLAQQEQSESTTQFLSSEMEQARLALAEQTKKMVEFKARYLGELPSQAQSNMNILVGMQSRYESLSARLNHALEQKVYLEALLGEYQSVAVTPQALQSATLANQDIARLRAELAEAQARYTELHPEVVRLQAQLAKAEAQRKADAGSSAPQDAAKQAAKAVTPSELQAVSAVMQVQSQLKANDQEIKDSREQLATMEKQIRDYEAKLNMSPIREQQLADLTRDYEQARTNYDSLQKKEQQSQLATNLEKRQEGEQFSVLDPPSLPQKATWPNRVKCSLGGLAGGLVLGLILAFFVDRVDPRLYSEKDVKGLLETGYPAGIEILSSRVLAGIPHILAPGEHRRKRLRSAMETALAVILLASMTAGTLLSFYKG